MSSDTDACVPQTLTDFVFDLYDSVVTSQLHEEQNKFYNVTFRELSAKYFVSSPWPSPQAIASECNGHPLFLALYREVTHRHWHTITKRPSLRDRIEGWYVYKELFDEILEDAEDANLSSTADRPNFYILPEWTFDILHEFVYQFQGFCQFRTSLHASATKHGVTTVPTPTDGDSGGKDGKGPAGTSATTSTTGTAPNHVIENLTIMSQNKDVWTIESVFYYLNRFASLGASPKCVVPAYQHLGLFASVALSRLECLLGDYTSCLEALTPLTNSDITVTVDSTGDGSEIIKSSAYDVVKNVFSARLSMAYHAGVAYLMLRRYKDAIRILGNICSYMQRGFKTGQLRKLPNFEQYGKLYDRMIALLAILTHICPVAQSGGYLIEDSILRTIREKHGSQLGKIDTASISPGKSSGTSGIEGYEELFVYASPKFISCAMPDYTQSNTVNSHDAYKMQVKRFMYEMSSQQSSRKLRSYLKLYTSIGIPKLASFNDMEVDKDFLPLLLSYKHKMRQLENANIITMDTGSGISSAGSSDTTTATTTSSSSLVDGKLGTALDIHYYLLNDMIRVDEAEKQRRFENFFMKQITQTNDIIKDIELMSTEV